MRQSLGGDSYIEADFSALEKLISNLEKDCYTDVGILGESGAKTEKGGITVAGIGAVHEFGTVINHPGGTPYAIGDDGRAIFLKKGSPGPKTKAHLIPIPKRSFILMPITKKQEQIQNRVSEHLQKYLEKADIIGIFKEIGIECEGVIQEAFETGGFGEWPDITNDTKKRKGSDSILIDHALLRKSIASKAMEN